MPKTPVQCPVCTNDISRKADLARHLQIHAKNKEDLMHPCTHPGCKFKTLQKSNLQTHQRTHTQDRSQTCPEHGCEFSTTDPGSLTRHRKNKHNYEPKRRRNTAGRDARRAAAAPYASRLVTPEASFAVLTAHPLSQAAQGPTNSLASSPISLSSNSSPISWRGSSSPFVVSPISSPSPPRSTSNHRLSPSISPLSTRSSTRSRMRTTRRPLTISLSISPSPEPM